MKSKLNLSLLIIVMIMMSANVFAQVTSDFDKSTDFTKYKTYSFQGWEKDSDKQLTEFDKKRILDSFKHEFDIRGMTLVESGGDVDVTLYVVVDKKTSTTAYTTYNGGMGYGGRWGWGGGMGMGSSSTSYSEDDYLEGTAVIDFYDSSTKGLIYQGVIRTVVKEKPEKREKSIPKNVAKLMAKYPIKPKKK
jgi:hypothetical protein